MISIIAIIAHEDYWAKIWHNCDSYNSYNSYILMVNLYGSYNSYYIHCTIEKIAGNNHYLLLLAIIAIIAIIATGRFSVYGAGAHLSRVYEDRCITKTR